MISKVVAVCSGKGGVGKTNICVNLALALTDLGRKVLLIDLDFGLANAEILLGIKPLKTFKDLKEENFDFSKLITRGLWGIDFISGGRGFSWLNNLTPEDRRNLLISWRNFVSDYEIVILDTAPSINLDNILFLKNADLIALVSTTEAPALLDAYVSMKTLFSVLKISKFGLLLNKTSNFSQAKAIFKNFFTCTMERLNVRLGYLGNIPYDESVKHAVNDQKPFYLTFPNSLASKSISRSANLLMEELLITTDEVSIEP